MYYLSAATSSAIASAIATLHGGGIDPALIDKFVFCLAIGFCIVGICEGLGYIVQGLIRLVKYIIRKRKESKK